MIRPAEHKDVPVLVDMAHEYFALGALDGTGLVCDCPTIAKLFRDLIANTACGIFLVAEYDGEVCGSIGGYLSPWMFNSNQWVANECWWFVPERHRNHLTAALGLFREFKAEAKRRGATTMVVSSTERPESERVRRFYAHIGLQMKDVNYIGRI